MGYRVAVVGATGAVGREMLKTLAERRFPPGRGGGSGIRPVGRLGGLVRREAGAHGPSLDSFDFHGWDIGAVHARRPVSAVHAPRAAAAGCVVIDNTSQFRMEPDVPLVVPEVNPHHLQVRPRNIIANPNCSTIQMVVALKPLHDRWRIKRVVVATYQSVSGAGKEGMDELFNHTKAVFVHDPATPAVHQGDRLQLHPAHRPVHGRRLD